MSAAEGWPALLGGFAHVFNAPSAAILTELVAGWVLAPGRRTVTRMIVSADPEGKRAHDAYHRFLRAGAWPMAALWRALATRAVALLRPEGPLELDLDDTLSHKSGRKIDGSGIFRDALRSTSRSVVHALGLNIVVLTLRVAPPWGGEPLGLPINTRLHRKGGPTPPELAGRACSWESATVEVRGRTVTRLVWSRLVLWYRVCPDALARLVVVRDPAGRQPDDFLFTTDVEADPGVLIARYGGRWSIEGTFRNTRQHLGGEDPQCWKGQGPE